VVARHDEDIGRGADPGKPVRHLPELLLEPDVGEVAGDDGVVRLDPVQVRDQGVQDLVAVRVAPVLTPGQVTEQAFAQEVPQPDPVQPGQVGV
jgi:hypothetical protein